LKIHFNKRNIPKYSLLSVTIFFDLGEIIFENFNIFKNNIISVELAKAIRVLRRPEPAIINKIKYRSNTGGYFPTTIFEAMWLANLPQWLTIGTCIAMAITYPVTLHGNRWAIEMIFNKALEVTPKPINQGFFDIDFLIKKLELEL
jgi:hypothetical protein